MTSDLSFRPARWGYWLATLFPGAIGAVIDAFAVGALLVMLTDSMIPEFFEHGGREAGLSLVLGLGVAVGMMILQFT